MRAAMRIDLGPARLVSGRPGGLGGRASLRGRAGPALAGGFERRWAGSTDIFKVLSNLNVKVTGMVTDRGWMRERERARPILC